MSRRLRSSNPGEARHHALVVEKAIKKVHRKNKPANLELLAEDVDFDKFVRDLIVMQTQRECPEPVDEYHMTNYVLGEPDLMQVLGDRRRKRLNGKPVFPLF
jgi:hypothetical protein